MTDNTAYLEMLKRVIRAGARRVGQADEHDLKAFSDLRSFLDCQLSVAVNLQLSEGKSWQDIGGALGISRQAAFKQFSKAKG